VTSRGIHSCRSFILKIEETRHMINQQLSEQQLSEERPALLDHFRHLAATSLTLEALQTGIVEAIALRLSYYSWTGFYMLDPTDPETLLLGPFVGDPTPHVRIPVTEGICGAAVALGKTVIVDDVNADPRYLSCSIKTRSEIVVPIYAHRQIIGEIDIDSHDLAAFTDADRTFLEEAARIVGAYVERNAEESL
jgi:L-methionine (R)-S-oxide reductase